MEMWFLPKPFSMVAYFLMVENPRVGMGKEWTHWTNVEGNVLNGGLFKGA